MARRLRAFAADYHLGIVESLKTVRLLDIELTVRDGSLSGRWALAHRRSPSRFWPVFRGLRQAGPYVHDDMERHARAIAFLYGSYFRHRVDFIYVSFLPTLVHLYRHVKTPVLLHASFRLAGTPPDHPGWFDTTQVEQVLINLIKNAHEAGGESGEVTVAVHAVGRETLIEVSDRGPGMSETVLAQALLPFYSTKRSGTGLGLAVAREISEAHGGRIALANREGGGLRVTLVLPAGTP